MIVTQITFATLELNSLQRRCISKKLRVYFKFFHYLQISKCSESTNHDPSTHSARANTSFNFLVQLQNFPIENRNIFFHLSKKPFLCHFSIQLSHFENIKIIGHQANIINGMGRFIYAMDTRMQRMSKNHPDLPFASDSSETCDLRKQNIH